MKRQANVQLNNIFNAEEEDDEGEQVFKQADKQELKKREIRMPKSRLLKPSFGNTSTNNFNTGIPMPSGNNPTAKATTTKPGLSQYANQLRSLNKSFLKQITNLVESNENQDISSLCSQYIKYRSEIKAPVSPLANSTTSNEPTSTPQTPGFQFGSIATNTNAPNAIGSLPSPAADTQPSSFNAPTSSIPPSIPTPVQSSFGSNNTSAKNDDLKQKYQFGTISKVDGSVIPAFQYGSTLAENAKPSFQFGSTPKPSESGNQFESASKSSGPPKFQFGSLSNKEQGEQADSASKPALQFGTPSTSESKPAETVSKPSFQFGSLPNKDQDNPVEPVSNPSFQFGSMPKEEQTKPAEPVSNPSFKFGSMPKEEQTKPAEPVSKPSFQFGAQKLESKPTEDVAKPNFQFGSSTSSFGTPSSKPDSKPLNPAAKPFEFKFGNASAAVSEVKPASTGFSFGSVTKPVDSSAKPGDSAPTLLPKPVGFTFGGATANFGNSTAASQAPAFGAASPGVAPTPSFGSAPGLASTPQFNFSAPVGDKTKPELSFGLQNLPTPAPLSTGFTFQPQAAPVAEEGGDEEAMPVLPQADLSKGAGEENDTTIYEVKAKIFTKGENKGWEVYGLGQLKLNKNQDTTRLICRSDTGKLLINSRLFKNMGVSAMGKSDCSLLMHIDDRVQPCLVRVKTAASRDELVSALKTAVDALSE